MASDDTLPVLAVALVGLVVVGDVLLLAVPATDALRYLLVALALPATGAVLAVAARRSPATGVAALLAPPVVAVYAYTGLLLPWTQVSFVVGQTLVELTLWVPAVGDLLAQLLFGGFTLSQATLDRAFTLHYAAVALGGLAWCGAAGPTLARRLTRGG
jgi:quinol-cytochrome oxidoreductase complex cytochrome b subunit